MRPDDLFTNITETTEVPAKITDDWLREFTEATRVRFVEASGSPVFVRALADRDRHAVLLKVRIPSHSFRMEKYIRAPKGAAFDAANEAVAKTFDEPATDAGDEPEDLNALSADEAKSLCTELTGEGAKTKKEAIEKIEAHRAEQAAKAAAEADAANGSGGE